MEKRPEYEELVDILARHVHDHWLYTPVTDADGRQINTFDHLFSSGQQITVAILEKLGIMAPVDERRVYYIFACEPEEFKKRAAENKHQGCEYDTLVLAFIGITDYGFPQDELEDVLVRLGLYEFTSEGKLFYTDRMQYYDRLYSDWPSLIE